MKVHIQLNLLIVAALYLIWALFLFMGQQQAHPLLSSGPYDAAASSMFGASLFAFVVLFITALVNPVKELIYASVTALTLLALVALYQLFLSGGMPQNPATFFSMLISATVAAILFFSMMQTPEAAAGTGPKVLAGRGRRTTSKARSARTTQRTATSKRRVTKSRTKAGTTKKKTSTARRKRR